MPRMRFSWVNLDGGGERCPHSSIKVGVFVHLMGIEGRNRNPDLMKEINDLISMVSLEVVTVFWYCCIKVELAFVSLIKELNLITVLYFMKLVYMNYLA